MMTCAELVRKIDHTLLRPEAGERDIHKLTTAALAWGFAAVCVNSCWIDLVRKILDDPSAHPTDKVDTFTAACAVVGFPFGTQIPEVKAFEAAACAKAGADEIDMVTWIPALLSEDMDLARNDIRTVTTAAKAVSPRILVKVILETALLNEGQIAMGCRAACEGGADFVKTSTGFHPAGGATVQAVRWLKKYSGGLGIKASGGIRDLATARAMLEAGADRIGCSAGVAIVKELA